MKPKVNRTDPSGNGFGEELIAMKKLLSTSMIAASLMLTAPATTWAATPAEIAQNIQANPGGAVAAFQQAAAQGVSPSQVIVAIAANVPDPVSESEFDEFLKNAVEAAPNEADAIAAAAANFFLNRAVDIAGSTAEGLDRTNLSEEDKAAETAEVLVALNRIAGGNEALRRQIAERIAAASTNPNDTADSILAAASQLDGFPTADIAPTGTIRQSAARLAQFLNQPSELQISPN